MQADFSGNLISPAAADRLIAAHDGDLALLYVFMQRTGNRDLERAAGELCRTLGEMQSAFEKLARMGLVEEGERCVIAERPAPRAVLPADEPPEYSAEEIVRRTREDSAFSAVLRETEQIYGKRLSTPDLRRLFGIYEHYGLPAEVIMELLHYCADISSGRLPTLRYIDRVACDWANREILTLEQAEEFISLSKQRRESAGKVAELLGIRGRQLSPSENRYINAWLDMGFGFEAIELAYDRTVTNTGGLKWGYMNKILSSWQEKGLYDVTAIEEKDSRRKPSARPAEGGKKIDVGDLDDLFGKI